MLPAKEKKKKKNSKTLNGAGLVHASRNFADVATP
jgi:hypothetical protein